MSNNQVNQLINPNKGNINLKQQYYTLKQKIADLEKQNLEMIEIYKSEEERLMKSNEFLKTQNNQNHSRNIKDLETDVLKMRSAIQQLNKFIEQSINSNSNLIESQNNINNKNSNLNKLVEMNVKEEYLKNYKNKLKTEFEQKLILKHKEFVDYSIEENKKIIENNENNNKYIDIEEIKYFSIKEKPEDKIKNSIINKNKENSNLEELKKKINENIDKEAKEIEVGKINKIISLLCLKEEYPKEFFIDYILDEAYSSEINKEDSFSKLLELEKEAEHEPENEIQKFIQKKPKRKSVFHLTSGFSGLSANKIANKIGKLFDLKYEEDIEIIKRYLNKIIISKNNLRHYFEQNLSKYRFVPYELEEKKINDETIRNLFDKDITKIKNCLNNDDNIINLDIFDEFLKKYYNDKITDDIFYYMISLMKLSKKERKEEKNRRIKYLGLFELYLVPLFQKVNK